MDDGGNGILLPLGELYLRLGRVGEAAEEYREAVALAPEDGRLRRRLAEVEAHR